MSLIVILMSGAFAGYLVPTMHERLRIAAPLSMLLGIVGGLLGGLGFQAMFSPSAGFDGLVILFASSFVYGALLIVAGAVVRTLLRAR